MCICVNPPILRQLWLDAQQKNEPQTYHHLALSHKMVCKGHNFLWTKLREPLNAFNWIGRFKTSYLVTMNLCRPKNLPFELNDYCNLPKIKWCYSSFFSEHDFPSQRVDLSIFQPTVRLFRDIWISIVIGKTSDAVNGCSRDTWKDMDMRAIICLKRSGGPENLPWTLIRGYGFHTSSDFVSCIPEQ